MYTKLVLSDTHLGLYKDSDIWLDVVIGLFQEVADTCVRNDINTIYHLGDFFDNRKSQNTKTTNTALKIADILKDFEVYIVAGNHDMYYKNQPKPNSLQIFKKHKNIIIVDEKYYQVNEYDQLVPWGCNEFFDNDKFVFGHFDISGFYMNDNYKSRNGMNANILKQFEKVYSGHFHTPSDHGNIKYIGSPFQQNFNDADSTRGYYLMDNDGQSEFIEFTSYPKFVKITPLEMNDIPEHIIPGNIVRLTFNEDYGTKRNTEIIDDCLAYKPLQLNTSFNVVLVDESTDIVMEDPDNLPSAIEVSEEYINKKIKTPKNISKPTLISMTKKLIMEVEG